jgi:hypothetical protein
LLSLCLLAALGSLVIVIQQSITSSLLPGALSFLKCKGFRY